MKKWDHCMVYKYLLLIMVHKFLTDHKFYDSLVAKVNKETIVLENSGIDAAKNVRYISKSSKRK